MTLFDELRNVVTETAKTAVKKSNEIVEITKLNISISDEQSKMKSILGDIGQLVYDMYKSGMQLSENIEIKCSEIDDATERIKIMKEKLSQLKKQKICPNCKKDNEIESIYCSRCGVRFSSDEE